MPKPRDIVTEKQFEYARAIADKLGISLPQDFTKQTYSEFIQAYSGEYKRECQRMTDEDYGFEDDDY